MSAPVANVTYDIKMITQIRGDAGHGKERAPARDPHRRQNELLTLSNTLQSTLEVETLIEIFARQLEGMLSYSSLEYRNPEEHLEVILGTREAHSCTYQLVLMERSLGEITLTRAEKFGPRESRRLENLLCALVYPLRNAILYRRAVLTAFRDPVTGVNNRAALDVALTRDIDLAHRHGISLSVIMIDIDDFKNVNDRYGHIAGDAVLKGVCDCVKDCIRSSDVLFRYGGEEFTVILSNTDSEGANRLAKRIRSAVENQEFVYDDVHIRATVSVGVAALESGEKTSELLDKADQALYRAKEAGRNRVVEFQRAPMGGA